MAIEKISNELTSFNITSASGDTVTNTATNTIKESILNGDYTTLVTVLETIIIKLDELTEKINSEHSS
tara:strand:+ start:419 stop:622 length:204 start_codon:yes stop_codon:yes gene_type:complete